MINRNLLILCGVLCLSISLGLKSTFAGDSTINQLNENIVFTKTLLEGKNVKWNNYINKIDSYFEKYENHPTAILALGNRTTLAKFSIIGYKNEDEISLLLDYIEYKLELLSLIWEEQNSKSKYNGVHFGASNPKYKLTVSPNQEEILDIIFHTKIRKYVQIDGIIVPGLQHTLIDVDTKEVIRDKKEIISFLNKIILEMENTYLNYDYSEIYDLDIKTFEKYIDNTDVSDIIALYNHLSQDERGEYKEIIDNYLFVSGVEFDGKLEYIGHHILIKYLSINDPDKIIEFYGEIKEEE